MCSASRVSRRFWWEIFLRCAARACAAPTVEALPEGALFQVEEKTVQVASVRADALCAHVWNLSRGDSLALFQAGRVFLNGRLCENSAAALHEGDVLSVRGRGRFIFRGVRGMTKKGRCNALVEVYV